MQKELAQEKERADRIAQLVVDFSQNAKGEELANVQNSQAFQEVWDYKGSEKVRWRLDRKREQVSHNYSAATHLFQKIYYGKDLTLNDERELRAAYFNAESAYNTMNMGGSAALFMAYFPLTYRLALKVRPLTLVFWTGAYYYAGYEMGLKPFTLWQFQSSLNSSAGPFAQKYIGDQF